MKSFSHIKLRRGVSVGLSALLITAFFTVTVAAQQNGCLATKRIVTEGGRTVYEQQNTYTPKGNLAEKAERFLRNEALPYTQTEAYTYDNRGNIVTVRQQLNGKPEKTTYRRYDADDVLVEESVEFANGNRPKVSLVSQNGSFVQVNGSDTTRTFRKKDPQGRIIEEIISAGNAPFSRTVNKYNPDGTTAETVQEDIPAAATRRTVFTYTASGKPSGETITVNGINFARYEFQYDTRGNLTQKTAYNRYGDKDYEIKRSYDNANNLLSEAFYSQNDLITIQENTYDARGNRLTETTRERGEITRQVRTEYTCGVN